MQYKLKAPIVPNGTTLTIYMFFYPPNVPMEQKQFDDSTKKELNERSNFIVPLGTSGG